MEVNTLKQRIQDDMKQAMRDGDKARLGAIRLLLSAIKQKEVDNKQTLGDAGLADEDILLILEKLCKQRRESIEQYTQANRQDLADNESFELEVLKTYMPEPLAEQAIAQIIDAAIEQTGASSMKDMGQVVEQVKQQVQGRADMKAVSAAIKARLANAS